MNYDATYRRKVHLVIATMALTGCTETAFEFRGMTVESSCGGAIAAEEYHGSQFDAQRGRGEDDAADATRFVLTGELYNRAVDIIVTCRDDDELVKVVYLAEFENETNAELLHRYFDTRLSESFGAPRTEVEFGARDYTPAGDIRPDAKPTEWRSHWCMADEANIGIRSDLKYRELSEFSVAVTLDFSKATTCE